MRACKLSYVPVIRPNTATTIMTQFFVNIIALGPLDELQAQTNSITGGKTNANAEEHRAPINERKLSNFGTISEMATVN